MTAMVGASGGGVRVVVAAAGYGKTSALRHWFPDAAARWHRVSEVDAVLASLRDGSARQVVLDGLPKLSAAEARALLAAVDGLPDGVTVALASRWPLAGTFPHRPGRPPTTQIRPADLALSTAQVEELLRTEYDLDDPDLPERVREATDGWPALVRLAAETLATHGVPAGPLAPALAEPGGPLATYLLDQVLDELPAQARLLLHRAAGLAPVTAGLCAALGCPDAGRELRTLARTGVLAGAGPDAPTGPHVVPVVAAVAGHGREPVARTALVAAAGWYRQHGPPVAAARTALLAGEPADCAAVLERDGDAMVTTGQPAAVAALVQALPPELRDRRLRLLAGDALRTAGDVAAAAQAYQAVADTETAWDPGLAWRMGLIHYLRGDQPAALACFDRGAEAPGGVTDQALLLAWRAAATARLGDAAAGAAHASEAYRLATESGVDGALATAHVSLALCLGLTGDQLGSEEHYAHALRIAERGRDLVLLARILVNQSYHLMKQARYPEAREAAGRAARYAATAGHANLRALATGNEADALTMLGRYDEAVGRYTDVLARYRRMGSRVSAAALLGLGGVYRLRGWREQAAATLDKARQLAEEGDFRELAVTALALLARVLLHSDMAQAAAAADEAARRATDDVRIPALVAQGWVAVAGGDRDRAAALAGEAVAHAHRGGHRAGLAEALELRAAAEPNPAKARRALREAHAIWAGAGAVAHAARVLLAASRLPGAGAEERLSALFAAERLVADGLSPDPYPAGGGDAAHPGTQAGVLVRTFGRFEVWLGDRPVPAASWQSRRARDLLRILVVRRGRPVPRGELCELLWPDDDAAKTGHRLSVLLSIVRGVLDPAKRYEPDHYLVADAASVALDVTQLRVDVLEFLAAVAHGRRLFERDAVDEARAALAAADRDYTADVFADEPYADWADALREQARAAHIGALRLLAQASRAASATAPAVEYLLRLLEKDPYDEPAHRALVRTLAVAGQHGEARRALARYRGAMTEIGVRPQDIPMPVALSSRPPPSRTR